MYNFVLYICQQLVYGFVNLREFLELSLGFLSHHASFNMFQHTGLPKNLKSLKDM